MQVGTARRRGWVVALLMAAAVWPIATAFAAAGDNPAGHASETIFILQIILLIAVGRGLGEVMQRFGQPSVMGELLAGLVLGPSIFGALCRGAKRDRSGRCPAEGVFTASRIRRLLLCC